ncbi:MAG: lipid II flippase MurJ [Candidatus Paceibacterota bacterium]
MVERFLKLLYQEIGGLHEAAFLLALFAFFSKILALLRDRLLAQHFGAGLELDIYYAAFRIPDFIYVSLASLVASAVLIPFIVHILDDRDRTKQFINTIFTVFFGAIVLVSAVVFFFMPQLSGLVAPGFTEDSLSELVLLSRIMIFSPFLLGLSGFFASITQSLRRFFVYALTPLLYNAGIIIGIIFFYPLWGLPGLAYGVVLGAILHMLIQIPVLIKSGIVPHFTFSIDWKKIREVLSLSLPRTVTLSAHHFVILVLVGLASLMVEGSISVFNLSFNLQSVPLSIIGVSYSIAAFPTLAKLLGSGRSADFVKHVVAAMRHIIFWSIPVIVLFVVLRAQIVRTILGTGEFGWEDTRLTAAALALFSISILAQSLILLFVRGYYAAGETRKPLIINVASSLFVIVLAFFFVWLVREIPLVAYFMHSLFRVEGVSGTEILMLPLAFSLGVGVNVLVLWEFFRKDFSIATEGLGRVLRQSIFSSFLMGIVAYFALQVFDDIFDINTFLGIFGQGALAGFLGIGAGILTLYLMDNTELSEIIVSLRRKFWKSEHLVPDQDEL